MKIKVLQLTDIHVGYTFCKTEELIEKITSALIADSQEVELVIFTGDIVDRKYVAPSDYNQKLIEAKAFFEGLLKGINKNQKLKLTKEDFLFVPGNHDFDREHSNFENYKKFLNDFYDGNIPECYNLEHFCVVKGFPKQRIAFAGFNSVHNDNGDNYGLISTAQLNSVIKKLKDINSDEEYNLVTFLHHHFYLIEERNKKETDSSVLRNSEEFLGRLNRFNLSLILHGHKHENYDRRIITTNGLSDGDKIATVLGCGPIGKENASYNAFNYLEIFSPDSSLELIYSEYQYKSAIFKLQSKPIKLPLKPSKYSHCELLGLLEEESELYKRYVQLKNLDTKTRADDMISIFDKTIGLLSECTKQITADKALVACVFAAAHYRSNYRYKEKGFVDKIEEFINHNILQRVFNRVSAREVFELLSQEGLREIYKKTKEVFDKASDLEKKRLTFMLIGVFLFELFDTLREKGEIFFDSYIKNKCNFGIESNSLNKNIEGGSIEVLADEERRALGIQVICMNAQAHKIVALIIKEFELLFTPFEEYFARVGFKIYYILPKINKTICNNKVELESFTFGTYLPTLINLLAGERLYSQTEVFTRELIQNSIDAIGLRQKLSLKEGLPFKEEGEIKICLREEGGRKVFEISDNGAGMHKYILERYFTTIGRSFYKSDDFRSLDVKFNHISNFGIGFLSCFLVGKRIEVSTRYIKNDENNEPQSFFLDIPNYDGCFFIENRQIDSLGTKITVYEDLEKKKFDAKKIISYLKNNILNIEYDILLEDRLVDNKTVTIKKFNFIEGVLRATKSNKLLFVLPFNLDANNSNIFNNNAVDMQKFYKDKSYREEFSYGVFVYKKDKSLYSKQELIVTNCGILVEKANSLLEKLRALVGDYFDVYINFPANFIELDVSRDAVDEQSKFYKFINENSNIDQLKRTIKSIYQRYAADFECESKTIPYAVAMYLKNTSVSNLKMSLDKDSIHFGLDETEKTDNFIALKDFFEKSVSDYARKRYGYDFGLLGARNFTAFSSHNKTNERLGEFMFDFGSVHRFGKNLDSPDFHLCSVIALYPRFHSFKDIESNDKILIRLKNYLKVVASCFLTTSQLQEGYTFYYSKSLDLMRAELLEQAKNKHSV